MKAVFMIFILTFLAPTSIAKTIWHWENSNYLFSLTEKDFLIFNKESKKIIFSAQRNALNIKQKDCKVNYVFQPRSFLNGVFSYFEEAYVTGNTEGCSGPSGYSYSIGIKNVDLKNLKEVSINKFFNDATILQKLKADTYIRKIAQDEKFSVSVKDMDLFFPLFADRNISKCDEVISERLRFSYFFDHSEGSNIAVRFAMSYLCGAPSDNNSIPKQIGVLLPFKLIPNTYFFYRDIKTVLGKGIEINI